MKSVLALDLVCPECLGRLALTMAPPVAGSAEASLTCGGCSTAYPIVHGIPRFVDAEHYSGSFGFQWNQHALTQLDSHSATDITRRRFQAVTGWTDLRGERVLEVGCGAGRFTQLLLETGADVCSVDASRAVDANHANNGTSPRLSLAQADLYRMPFKRRSFDRVFCLGVLQHTPDVRKSFDTLVSFVKPGGEIVVDVYDLTFRAFVNPKYWLRPITTRMDRQRLYRLVCRVVPVLYPVRDFLTRRVPLAGKYIGFLVPVAYHAGFVAGADRLTYAQQIEWSILDTFDKFAPAYDRPQRIGTVRQWFEQAGLEQINVRYGPNGIIGHARVPLDAAVARRVSVAR